MLQVLYKWCAHRLTPPTTLNEIMYQKAEALYRDTVSLELNLIDDQHKIKANTAKANYLLSQIATPRQVGPLP